MINEGTINNNVSIDKFNTTISGINSGKANISLDNLNSSGTAQIANYSMPAYTTGIAFAGRTWTYAPYDCFVTGGAAAGSGISQQILVSLQSDGSGSVRVAYAYGYSQTLGAFVPKGYYFYVDTSAANTTDTICFKIKGVGI